MANARLVTPKPVKQPPKRIILELSEGEADFIFGVIGVIGGDPQHSPRKYADTIREALKGVLGYDWDGSDAYKLTTGRSYVSFENYPTRKAGR